MTPSSWYEEPINRQHDRRHFDCGEPELNEFLARYARQNHADGSTKTWVATPDSLKVFGYYTLSPASVAYDRVPDELTRNQGRYAFPAFRLGRLAVDLSCQGQGLGGALLVAAGRRCLYAAEHIGGTALLIDAKNERVANWYQMFGAVPLLDAPLSLLLPLATIVEALNH